VTLAAWTVAAFLFGRWQFMRSLRFDLQAAQAAPTAAKDQAWTGRLYRLPSLFLPDPLAAMVEKELRSLARTPRFRMVFIMGLSFGAIIFPTALRGGARFGASSYFLPLICLYALTLLGQVTYWNAFGFDASAAQLYFLAPVSIRRSLAGKNIAAAIFIFLEIAAVSLACSLIRGGISAAKICEAFLVTGVAALYLLGIGNLGSINYPRAMNAQRVSAGGARGRTQGLIFIFYPAALLPIVLAYLARYAFDSQTVFLVSLAGAAGLGATVYYLATESAVSAARIRREIIMAELSRGDGPLVAE
jgi:ABC-2 type transport system permease protein